MVSPFLTTPSALSKELRDIFLMRSHPSYPRRGLFVARSVSSIVGQHALPLWARVCRFASYFSYLLTRLIPGVHLREHQFFQLFGV